MRFDMHDLTEGVRVLELAQDVVRAWVIEFQPNQADSQWDLEIDPPGGAIQRFRYDGGESFTDLCLMAVRQIRQDIAAGGIS